jgi:N-acetylglucosamine-6-phosphate deacetylase
MDWSNRGVVFRNFSVVSSGDTSIREVRVHKGRFSREKCEEAVIIDGDGLHLTPGLIDLQIHGYGGKEFLSGDEAICLAQEKLPASGVTSFLPTIGSQPIERYRPSLLRGAVERAKKRPGAEVIGWHLEGPFLHPLQAGAHRAITFLDRFDEPFWREVFATGAISLMTLAPELAVADKVLDVLQEYNITAACGHSQADIPHLLRAKTKGVKFVTHLFNAMLPFHHRAPGIIGAVLGGQILGYTLICDLHHLHPEAIQIAWRSHPSGLALISDAAPLLGSDEQEGCFMGTRVSVSGERVLTVPSGNIAGSIVPLDEHLRRFIRVTGCRFAEAVRMASEVPASFLDIKKQKGKIAVGYDADCVLWEEKEEGMRVIATVKNGNLVFSLPEFLQRVHT